MKRVTAPALLLLLAAPAAALADTGYYVSSAGDDYALTVNDSGFVLQSRYPKARFVEKGVDSYVERGVETFYFGRNCDASHALFGAGKWGWANGGFGADFEGGFRLRFPRQELPGPHGAACRW